MEKGALIFEDKLKRTYLTDDPERFALELLDGEVEYEGGQAAALPGKGPFNMRIAAAVFRLLESNGCVTHFVAESGERELAAVKTKRFPLEIVCHNMAAGKFAQKMSRPEGEVLPLTMIEFHLQTNALREGVTPAGKPLIFTEVTDGEAKIIYSKTLAVNRILKPFFDRRGLILADYRIEFGRDSAGQMRVTGAICPDTCTIWDRDTHEKIDKDRFRRPLRGTTEAYNRVLRSIAAEN
jgi:phosphoribosylaminoimidazole-succinocarboxamide synthase